MYSFVCDYLEGAHPSVLEALARENLRQHVGYGEDELCGRARDAVRSAAKRPDAAVHFCIGGTQTNFTLIAAALRPHQGVLCAATGHIAVHESGAVEACGHKVLPLPTDETGKITADAIRQAVLLHRGDPTCEHMVQPALVYLSQSTEKGCVYSLSELDALYRVTRELGLLLYIDGARLGYALGSPYCDMDLAALACRCDAFTLGGTKQGALFGEALVLNEPMLDRDFRYIQKQRGAMLAKGFLLGLQFDCLLKDGLYFRLGEQAVTAALRIAAALAEKGIAFLAPPQTNQIFPLLPDALHARLSADFAFEPWAPSKDGLTPMRICVSWATPDEATDALIAAIQAEA